MVLFGFVLALTGEGEGEALAACGIVTGCCRESVGELVAYDNGGLASAGGALAAGWQKINNKWYYYNAKYS